VRATSLSLVGGYNVTYPRTDVIIRGCEANGIDVRHMHVRWGAPWQRKLRLWRLLRRERIDSDFALVPAPCHHEVPIVKRWARCPVVFDPLYSRYLTKVYDYRRAGRYSLHALINFRVDRKSMSEADYVLSDTEAHKEYYCRTFGISPRKVFPLYVGYNSNDFRPVDKPRGRNVVVGFYGGFIPLQGADVIVEAANLLKHRRDIAFELLGSGHTHAKAVALARTHGLTNISFPGRKPYSELAEHIGGWDICLGIFGTTPKADLVIPNKVYHYAGCRKPIISKKSPAIREVFTDSKDILLCDAQPRALADAIARLAADTDLCAALATAAHRLVSENYTHVQIGARLRALLERWKSDGGM
jgi:glycosyltransferase involved in cell wall biosynthesis